jgi:NAD(P)-dependent dehydrogenase (short-subunit alcohol dehydrogenase family)
MAVKDSTTTAEGIELQFGRFLLTNLLVPKILAAGKGARIINVSSFGYMAAGVRFDDWNFKVLLPILYGLKY